MFDELITMIDALGIDYIEDYDVGTLTVDVSKLDKAEIINLVQAVNDSAMAFTIDESSLIVTGGEIIEEPALEEGVEADISAEDAALAEFSGM